MTASNSPSQIAMVSDGFCRSTALNNLAGWCIGAMYLGPGSSSILRNLNPATPLTTLYGMDNHPMN